MLACLAPFLIAISAVDTTPTRPINQLVHTRCKQAPFSMSE